MDMRRVTDDIAVEQLALLTAGVDMWHLEDAAEIGLRSIKVSDGPAGARGERWFAASSACVPCGTAIGATWDPSVVAEVATLLAAETRRKGADVLLAPTVNLHRHPLAGRNFECMSEDPELTAVLATAHIAALQAAGVAACIKHFVANDQETDRHEISAEVPEVALRELYLRPFEAAVRDAGTWSVMAAYNRLDGTHCSQHQWLLGDLLRDEWGFEGAVISDWWGTHDTAALTAGLDVEMPGPARHMGSAAVEAVANGAVPESAVRRAGGAILHLASLVGALGPAGSPPEVTAETSIDDPADHEVLRRAAVESIVLMRNDHDGDGRALLPLGDISSVAVIGPNAASTAIMGGGSAAFVPHRSTDVLSSLRQRLPGGVEVTHRRGTPPPQNLRGLDPATCRIGSEADASPGFLVEHFDDPDGEGGLVLSETSLTSRLLWLGTAAPGVAEQGGSVRLSTWLTPTRSGPHTFGLVTGDTGRVILDGAVVLDNTDDRRPGTAFFGMGSEEIRAEVELTAGRAVHIEALTRPLSGLAIGGMAIGHAEPTEPDPLGAAVDAAGQAEVAIVVVGGDDQWETEGVDRAGFELPGGQPELVRAVCAANPNTIVVLNCGAPVDVSFAERAPVLLSAWYGGQEVGEAIVDVLLGEADPGGRLPTTWAHRVEHHPSDANFPGSDGRVSYEEGLNIGYRGFDAEGIEPAFCFGHGLSTTSFEWSDAALLPESVDITSVTPDAAAVVARVAVRNTGDRAGTEVVQCYLAATAGAVLDPQRPPQHLAGFAKVHLAPGESADLEIPIGWRALRRWVPGSGWEVPTGEWEVRLSSSSRDHRCRLSLEVTGSAGTGVGR